ncbi:hypothetical protein [Streptomyces sp. NPDC058374]|uniref:hypothetical protein n=1 Tax=Streptomyces sp. NPDC058374 TaxID=3346466 RepID=UPI00364E5C59
MSFPGPAGSSPAAARDGAGRRSITLGAAPRTRHRARAVGGQPGREAVEAGGRTRRRLLVLLIVVGAEMLAPMALLGAGVGLAIVPLDLTILATTRPEDTGVTAGILQAALTVGGTVGLTVLLIPYHPPGRGARHRRPGRLRLGRGDRGPVAADRGDLPARE